MGVWQGSGFDDDARGAADAAGPLSDQKLL
jgi:hypothetical protein